ncbi:hypothetical protein JC2156_00070 [Weissella koreensis KCTC 3621]|nr:hypothetical protein JC2156_00070 [Weissella koreensis KCTC 3621]
MNDLIIEFNINILDLSFKKKLLMVKSDFFLKLLSLTKEISNNM